MRPAAGEIERYEAMAVCAPLPSSLSRETQRRNDPRLLQWLKPAAHKPRRQLERGGRFISLLRRNFEVTGGSHPQQTTVT